MSLEDQILACLICWKALFAATTLCGISASSVQSQVNSSAMTPLCAWPVCSWDLKRLYLFTAHTSQVVLACCMPLDMSNLQVQVLGRTHQGGLAATHDCSKKMSYGCGAYRPPSCYMCGQRREGAGKLSGRCAKSSSPSFLVSCLLGQRIVKVWLSSLLIIVDSGSPSPSTLTFCQ